MNNCGWKNALRFFFLHFSFFTIHSSSFIRQLRWRWSVWMDSNHRPRAYQARALTTWATNRYSCVDSSHLSARVVPCSELLFLYHREWTLEFPLNHPEWSRRTLSAGGDDGIRTHDPLLAGQVLSQLSYTPIPRALFFSRIISGPWKLNNKRLVLCFLCTDLVLTRMTGSWHPVPVSIERRWSSRTFRYGYLVTT